MATKKYANQDSITYLWTKIKLAFATKSEIPTNNNQLTNGAGYQTNNDVVATVTGYGYQTESQVNTIINGKGYQTADQVNTAITGKGYQTSTQVDAAITEALKNVTGIDFIIVQSLEEVTNPKKGVIYLVPNSGSGNNTYDEYIYITTSSKFEKIGTTDVDLSDYLKATDVVVLTTAEIDAAIAAAEA